MIFISNSNNLDGDIELKFENEFLNFSNCHRHLGVTFNAKGKWSDHIENTYISVLKKLNALRKLKYMLKRDTLLKIYKTFILPVLEYACELWDGCNVFESNLLEKAQREAARIITGLPSYASNNSLYFETGLEPLSDRRKRRKLQLLYKMKNHLTPDFLNSILPQQVGQHIPYGLRNRNDFVIPKYRLSSTNSSFLPSTLRLWNELDHTSRSSPSLNIFKNAITPDLNTLKPPNYYGFGDRKINIIHTKVRYQNSSLKYD